MDLYTRIFDAVNAGVGMALNESFHDSRTIGLLREQLGGKLQWFLKLYSRVWSGQDPAGRAGICFDQFVRDEDYVLIELPEHIDGSQLFDPDDAATYKYRFISSWPISTDLEDAVRKVIRERWSRYMRAMTNSGIRFVESVAARAKWYLEYPMTNLQPYYDMLSFYITRKMKEQRIKDSDDVAYSVLSGKLLHNDEENEKIRKAQRLEKFCKFYQICAPRLVEMLPVVWLQDYVMVLTPEGVAKCSDQSYAKNNRYIFNNTDEWDETPVSGEHHDIFYNFVRLTYCIRQAEDFIKHANPRDLDVDNAKKFIETNMPFVEQLRGIIRKTVKDKKEQRSDMLEAKKYLSEKDDLNDREKSMLAYLNKKLGK